MFELGITLQLNLFHRVKQLQLRNVSCQRPLQVGKWDFNIAFLTPESMFVPAHGEACSVLAPSLGAGVTSGYRQKLCAPGELSGSSSE